MVSKNNFYFSSYKSLSYQIWPCHKIDQSQPKVIIFTILVVLMYPMLHTKFQGHWLIVYKKSVSIGTAISEEKSFESVNRW